MGKYSEAAFIYESLISMDPSNEEWLANYLACHVHLGVTPKISSKVESYEILFNLACGCIQRKEYAKAKQLLLQALEFAKRLTAEAGYKPIEAELEMCPIYLQLDYLSLIEKKDLDKVEKSLKSMLSLNVDPITRICILNNLVILAPSKELLRHLRSQFSQAGLLSSQKEIILFNHILAESNFHKTKSFNLFKQLFPASNKLLTLHVFLNICPQNAAMGILYKLHRAYKRENYLQCEELLEKLPQELRQTPAFVSFLDLLSSKRKSEKNIDVEQKAANATESIFEIKKLPSVANFVPRISRNLKDMDFTLNSTVSKYCFAKLRSFARKEKKSKVPKESSKHLDPERWLPKHQRTSWTKGKKTVSMRK